MPAVQPCCQQVSAVQRCKVLPARTHSTLRHHHVVDLQMEPLITDPGLYFRRVGERLIGMSGCYVDDMLRCGTPEHFQSSKATSALFDATPEVLRKAKFAGVNMYQTDDGIWTGMNEYTNKLELPQLQSWKNFASFCAKMAWLVYVRPDICAQAAKLAQITESQFILNPIECFLSLGKCLNSLKAWVYRLYYPKLDLDTLFIRVYADASFGTNRDGSSQLGYCIVLMDKTGRFSLVKYRSGKFYRVTHSAMAAETCAFAEAFDAAFVVKHSLEQLLGKKIPLQMLTDSKQLFDSISHSTHTKERRIMTDIAASKQSFERAEISDLGLVATECFVFQSPDNPLDKGQAKGEGTEAGKGFPLPVLLCPPGHQRIWRRGVYKVLVRGLSPRRRDTKSKRRCRDDNPERVAW
jgi:hypothetical protein